VQVRVVKVDMESTKIDFVLDEEIPPNPPFPKGGERSEGRLKTAKKPAVKSAKKPGGKKRHG